MGTATLEVLSYEYDDTQVRVTMGEDGRPRFVAADVAIVLGYAGGARPAIARLPGHMKGVAQLNTPGGQQNMTVLTEAGVNRLIMRAKTERAEKVQDWLAEEVMPSIARTGRYEAPVTIPAPRQTEALDLPGDYIAALERLVIAEKAKLALAAENEKQQELIDELTPAAAAWETFASGQGTTDVGTVSKMLANAGFSIGQNNLFKKLGDLGWAYQKWQGDKPYWVAYERHVKVGRLTMKGQSRPRRNSDGEVIGYRRAPEQLRITRKGMEDLLIILAREKFSQTALALESGDIR